MQLKFFFVIITLIPLIACEQHQLNNFNEKETPFSPARPAITGGETAPPTVYAFKMGNTDTAGWEQSPYESSFRVVTGDSLYTVINGGAQPYIEKGYQKALKQEMEGPDEQRVDIMVVDFGTAAKAEAFFRFKIATSSEPANIKIPGYDTTVVLGCKGSGGMTLFIKYENIYIDLLLMDFYIGKPIPDIARLFIDIIFRNAGISGTGIRVRR